LVEEAAAEQVEAVALYNKQRCCHVFPVR
jgi:hypothetical protein